MKKTLILVRHATAEDHSFRVKDFDRELVSKGLSESAIMGRWLVEKNIKPDHFVTSPASRAYKTAEIVADQFHLDISEIELVSDIYDGGPKAYLSAVNRTAENTEKLILFGHNPDISYFGEYLSGKNIGSMKKAGMVILEFEDLKWEEISAKTATFISYITPKEVKEAS
ncbi:SixA phosphatase family protein [Dyadobacter psychrotolerans]|uniref:Phosphohistidine phosphatase n=1 Tax=Dyadobacter psychrotolerans TaxID=2541721 RepID=A0A4R5DQN0_9BACT|nr:histidine phosphatase family protein [Dyadobacter psychrotolerans]TDE16579.1 phosphohistidine phosphatase [Dyadobacter psychrotolerans]